jgi:hypothetical protein
MWNQTMCSFTAACLRFTDSRAAHMVKITTTLLARLPICTVAILQWAIQHSTIFCWTRATARMPDGCTCRKFSLNLTDESKTHLTLTNYNSIFALSVLHNGEHSFFKNNYWQTQITVEVLHCKESQTSLFTKLINNNDSTKHIGMNILLCTLFNKYHIKPTPGKYKFTVLSALLKQNFVYSYSVFIITF